LPGAGEVFNTTGLPPLLRLRQPRSVVIGIQTGPLINTGASAPWIDARRASALFQQFVRSLTHLTYLTSLALLFSTLPLPASASASPTTNRPTVLLILGAPGEPEFGSNFVEQVHLWEKTCEKGNAKTLRIGLDKNSDLTDHDLLKQTLAEQPTTHTDPLWLVFIGHGTFDGKEARFNLRGPDLSDAELAEWLKPFQRPIVLINCASASAPFLKKLSATNRVVITATRSGNELNYARFGEYMAKAIADPASDLDKDGEVSVLEAFLMASRRVTEFYKTEGRLATEHALLDDNGDGLGTPADWFRGGRAVKKAKDGASLDGARASQFHLVLSPEERAVPPDVRARRDALELEVAKLRDVKSQMTEDDYYRQLEAALLKLARLQEPQGSSTNDPAR